MNPDLLQPPPAALMWRELRVLRDLAVLPGTLAQPWLRRRQLGQGRTVIVLPGFGGGDGSMAPLRTYLRLHGFRAEGWGLGRNLAGLDQAYDPSTIHWEVGVRHADRGEGGVLFLAQQMAERVTARARQLGTTVSLVGWSLGGTIAREVARDHPDVVDHVVTLGSPVQGGPKYTRAADRLRSRGLDLEWIEAEVAMRNRRPILRPVSAIISPSDGVVGFAAARDPLAPASTRYIQEDVAHISMGLHPRVLRRVVEELSRSTAEAFDG